MAKGKKVLDFDLRSGDHEDADLEKAVIGPSGNLRAPTMRLGKTWVVGYNDELFESVFG